MADSHRTTVVAFDALGTLLNFKPMGAGTALMDTLPKGTDPGVAARALLVAPAPAAVVVNLLGGQGQSKAMTLYEYLAEKERAALTRYPDAEAATASLRAHGIRVVACVSTPLEFQSAVAQKLDGLADEVLWSFETGGVGGDSEMLDALLHITGKTAGEIAWVSSRPTETEKARTAGFQVAEFSRTGETAQTLATLVPTILASKSEASATGASKSWWPTEEEIAEFARRKQARSASQRKERSNHSNYGRTAHKSARY